MCARERMLGCSQFLFQAHDSGTRAGPHLASAAHGVNGDKDQDEPA